MKGTVIFADQDQPAERTQRPHQPSPDKVVLSREELRETVKEAYKEGLEDAQKKPSSINERAQKALEKSASQNELSEPIPKAKPDKKSIAEGKKEAQKTEAKVREQTRHKLENISQRHDLELIRAQGVFPFDLFPDTIIIDTTKITLVRKQMLATEQIITIPLKDVSDAHVQTALFLASVTFAYMPHASSPGMLKPEEETITCLRREDAIRIKNIIKGVLVAIAEEIDLAKLSPEEVENVIEKFGHSEGVT